MSEQSSLNVQIGGSHYKDCKIQPVEFIEANNLKFLEGCVVKRVSRHDKPTGKGRQDIEKAIHELQLLLELRYCSKLSSSYENIDSLKPGIKIDNVNIPDPKIVVDCGIIKSIKPGLAAYGTKDTHCDYPSCNCPIEKPFDHSPCFKG